MGTRKKPVFGSRDLEEIKKKQENGGISENTKARRRGVNNVFDECQKTADRPTLKELCEARDKDGLENDLQGFFQAYYVRIGTEDTDDIGDDEENDLEPASGDKDQESENGDLDDLSEDENDEIDDKSDSGTIDEKDDIELTQDEKEVMLRPKGNTSLSYKSHIKMLIKEFTGNEFDISDTVQFPKFNVSTYVK
jgi:hypothetical protein